MQFRDVSGSGSTVRKAVPGLSFGSTTILWCGSGDRLSQGNTYLHRHAIKRALWWAPSSTVLIVTLNWNLIPPHTPTHTHTQSCCCCCDDDDDDDDVLDPQGDPSQVPCSVCMSSLCLRRFRFGQCGCSAPLGLKVTWEDACRHRHGHKLPVDIQDQHLPPLLQSRQLFWLSLEHTNSFPDLCDANSQSSSCSYHGDTLLFPLAILGKLDSC